MESEEVSGGNAAVVNFYTELGLDRTWAVDQLQAKLQKLKLHWGRRASLAGKHGDEARERLSVIEAALNIFSDEDAKERYDYRLRHTDSVVSDDEVNWVARAWTYYFAEDYDAAAVAARKARERGSSDPAAYVVSAWIELAQYQAERASHQYDYDYLYDDTPAEQGFAQRAGDYASEAYVLDENGDNAFEVQEVRGVVFYVMKKYDRAIEAFKKALTLAEPTQVSEVYLRIVRTYMADYNFDCALSSDGALSSCLAGLRECDSEASEDELVECARLSINRIIGVQKDMSMGDREISEIKSLRRRVDASDLTQSKKQRLYLHLDNLLEYADLRARTRVRPAPYTNPKPGFPFMSVGIFLFYFFGLIAIFPKIGLGESLPGFLTWLFILFLPLRLVFYRHALKKHEAAAVESYEAEARYEADKARIEQLDCKIWP